MLFGMFPAEPGSWSHTIAFFLGLASLLGGMIGVLARRDQIIITLTTLAVGLTGGVVGAGVWDWAHPEYQNAKGESAATLADERMAYFTRGVTLAAFGVPVALAVAEMARKRRSAGRSRGA